MRFLFFSSVESRSASPACAYRVATPIGWVAGHTRYMASFLNFPDDLLCHYRSQVGSNPAAPAPAARSVKSSNRMTVLDEPPSSRPAVASRPPRNDDYRDESEDCDSNDPAVLLDLLLDRVAGHLRLRIVAAR